jgi:hypothetical protein
VEANVIPAVVEVNTQKVTHKSAWHSAAIVHYLGNGLWAVGLVPADPQSNSWEWLVGLTNAQVVEAVDRAKLVRCPTESLKERLRNAP